METNEIIRTPEEVPSSVSGEKPTSKFHILKYIIIGVLILMVGVAGGMYFSRNFSKATDLQITPIPSQVISPMKKIR